MKLTIKTDTLQDLVAKSMKGASCNKMIPLTGLMAVELKDHTLTLITTDATNYLYVRQEKVDGEDFYVVVQAELFSKLVSRLTCGVVVLELSDNALTIKGNGTYRMELPLDEEGEPVRYPDPLHSDTELDSVGTVHLSTVKLILNTAKAALADSTDILCYTGYYVGNKIVATDTYKICGIDIEIFDEPALVAPSTMNLLDIFVDENIEVSRKNNTVVFDSASCTVYGKLMDCLSDFQIDVIGDLLNQEFGSTCKVSKASLLQLLDRLVLFVSAYDKNGIYLTFTRNGLQIDSKQANSSELIQYTESRNFVDFTCCIDIEMFRSQVKANTGDAIEIHYGEENAIKLTDGNVTQIVALLEDDRVS